MHTRFGNTENGKSTISKTTANVIMGYAMKFLDFTAEKYNNLIWLQLIFAFFKGKIRWIV